MNPDIFSQSARFIEIRKFGREKTYNLNFYGLKRRLPIYGEGRGIGVVGNTELSFGCDVEFTKLAVKKLLNLLDDVSFDCILR